VSDKAVDHNTKQTELKSKSEAKKDAGNPATTVDKKGNHQVKPIHNNQADSKQKVTAPAAKAEKGSNETGKVSQNRILKPKPANSKQA